MPQEFFRDELLSDDNCFLCGSSIDEETGSQEHVFPKWVQNKFKLFDDLLTLLNGTKIRYRDLKIPCCKDCNNIHLSRLERDVQSYVSEDFSIPNEDIELRLFQWTSKIMYGLLRKELSLLTNRCDASSKPIVPPDLLKAISTFHHFMTSIRRPFTFLGFSPYSIFVLQLQEDEVSFRNFEYIDFLALGFPDRPEFVLVTAIQLGKFGIICVPNDNGAQSNVFHEYFLKFSGQLLHPLQFIEISCKVAAKNYHLCHPPTFSSITFNESDGHVLVIPHALPEGEIWREYDPLIFAREFVAICNARGFDVGKVEDFLDKECPSTFLFNPDGSFRYMPYVTNNA